MTEDEAFPADGDALPETPPRPQRWWIAGIALAVAGALLATFIPGLLPRERTGSGTGFVIAMGGYILTSAHVVRGATEITVHWSGRGYNASIVTLNSDYDLALLVCDSLPPVPAVAVAGGRPELGDPVTAVGHPGGTRHPTARSTTVAGVGWWAVGADGNVLRDLVATDDPFRPGYSGSPLVNEAGHVVGIVTGSVTSGTGKQFGFAVSIQQAAGWLAGRGMALSLESERPASALREADLLSRVAPSVVRVESRLPPGSP